MIFHWIWEEDWEDVIIPEICTGKTLLKLIRHYKYNLSNFPEIAHYILEKVDKVVMEDWLMFVTKEDELVSLGELSGTCRLLLCLALDVDGLYRYRTSAIGITYHEMILDISNNSNAYLYLDTTVLFPNPKRKFENIYSHIDNTKINSFYEFSKEGVKSHSVYKAKHGIEEPGYEISEELQIKLDELYKKHGLT